jgi:radical SAM protein with 4Fe4S-binding SPASM domain
MRHLICRGHCRFYRPEKDEPETCLPFAALSLGAASQPQLSKALAGLAPGHPVISLPPALLDAFCRRCVFRNHGCDFAAAPDDPEAAPCGGLKVLASLLAQGVLTPQGLPALLQAAIHQGYLCLGEHVSLKRLETPYLYDRLADELYEVNDAAFAWLARCDGATPGLAREADAEFLAFLLDESLLSVNPQPRRRQLRWREAPTPSLRYLELMLTDRCNLRCRHCYLGDAGRMDLPLEGVLSLLREFEQMQGLRVLLSGGEPLLYPHFEALNARLRDFELRFVLLTNGTLLAERLRAKLRVQEVQVSLDGLAAGHDLLRGPGAWERAMSGLAAAQEAGLEVSAATMIHRGNLAELEELGRRLITLGVREWSLDAPCAAGRWLEHPELMATPTEAAPYLDLGFGGSAHGAAAGFACGRHLAAVLPTGQVAKCGLFGERPLGHVSQGLENCWLKLEHLELDRLDCAPCPHLAECRGGCRFRAGATTAPDPVMCARFGVDPAKWRVKP